MSAPIQECKSPVRTHVVLAAHGDGDDAQANIAVRAIARQVARELDEVAGVSCMFNLGSPRFSCALDALRLRTLGQVDRVVVVPLMLSEGYFTGEVLPREIAKNVCVRDDAIDVRTVRPIGVRDALLDDLVASAEGAARARFDRERLTVLIVAHGTRRNSKSDATTRELAGRVGRSVPWAEVRSAFLDQGPLLEDVAPEVRSRDLLVLPFLLGGGGHALEDVPERIGFAPERTPINECFTHNGRRVLIQRPVMGRSILPDLVAGCVREELASAATDAGTPCRPIRLGTRTSALAWWQAERVARALRTLGASVEFVEASSMGDREVTTPMEAFGREGVFTDELDESVRTGAVDVAQHSLKDLPIALDQSLCVAAVLERDDPREVLVTRDGCTLDELPAGAVVGTSSSRRRLQLAAIRPDLNFKPIRGSVPARVEQVMRGDFDATVLAACGLERLGMESVIAQRFTLDEMLPEPGQAVVALVAQCDSALAERLAMLDHADTRSAVDAERAFAQRVNQHDPSLIAACCAQIEKHDETGDTVRLHACVISHDGRVSRSVCDAHTATEAAASVFGRLVLAEPRGVVTSSSTHTYTLSTPDATRRVGGRVETTR